MSATHSTGSGRPVHGPVARERIHVLVDRQGRLVRWSPAAERLLGYPEDAVRGCSALDLLAGPAPDQVTVALRHRDG
ncbi:PAS domain-containing protein, partial [Streptomyces spinoverrucosus]